MIAKRPMYALYALGFLCASSGLALAQDRSMDVAHNERIESNIHLVRQATQAETAKAKAAKRFIRFFR